MTIADLLILCEFDQHRPKQLTDRLHSISALGTMVIFFDISLVYQSIRRPEGGEEGVEFVAKPFVDTVGNKPIVYIQLDTNLLNIKFTTPIEKQNITINHLLRRIQFGLIFSRF